MRYLLSLTMMAVLFTARLLAQDISPSTTFTAVSQSPPYLNCDGRLEVSNWQGTVLMRATASIRDAAGNLKATNSTGEYSPSNPLYIATEYGTQNGDTVGTWHCHLHADVILDYGDPQQASSSSQQSVCPGTPGQIRQEYIDRGVTPVPACEAIVTCCRTTNFSWAEYNDNWSNGNPHTGYGMVTNALKTGVEQTRDYYGRGRIRLSSGYRCPDGNFAVGGVPNSPHMHGRAADMYSADHPWTETEFNLLKAAADNTGASTLNWTSYTDHHLHAAW